MTCRGVLGWPVLVCSVVAAVGVPPAAAAPPGDANLVGFIRSAVK